MPDALSYGFKKKVDGSIDDVEVRVRDALGAGGFGVLTQLAVSGRADLGPLAEEVSDRMQRALNRF